LGQSLLEGKKYPETADVFKRVLTVFPDDFIAHVGMSIVRESENNLDAAIWHMELAFDSQPSNITIQEELKRLFGRRDGTHPTKIRLTRGALVRMYARGELYQQAIAEINSALSEDIKRLDLEVFLARMYFLSGDQKSSIDLCHKLEKEIPYGYEVNKILFETSPAAGQSDTIYAKRMCELDPYESFVNPKFPSAEDIAEDKVSLEELSELSISESAKDSTWVNALNGGWDKPSFVPEPQISGPTASIPGSTSGDTDAFPPVSNDFPFDDKDAAFTPIPDDLTPTLEGEKPVPATNADWMSAPSDSPFGKVDSTSDVNPEPSAQPSEVPDWLRSLVPENGTEPATTSPSEETAQAFTLPKAEEIKEQVQPITTEFTPINPAVFEQEKGEMDNSDLPDWLKNFDAEKSSEPVSQDDLPDWLNSLQDNTTNTAPVEKSNPAFSETPSEPPSDQPFTDLFPESSNEPAAAFVSETGNEESKEPISAETVEESKGETLEVETSEVETPATEASTVPDWIRMLHSNEEEAEGVVETSEQSEETIPMPVADITQAETPASSPLNDLLSDITETPNDGQAISDKTSDELLDWLRDLKPEDNQSVIPDIAEGTQEPSGDTAGLAYDFDAELNKLNQIASEPGAPSELQPETIASPVDDTDDFLKSLAGFQSSKAEAQTDIQSIEDQASTGEEIPTEEISLDSILGPSAFEPVPEPVVETVIESEPEPAVDAAPAETGQSPALVEKAAVGSVEHLLTVVQQKPNDHISWQKLGDAYASLGKYSDALNAYGKAEQILLNLK
jgi:hypothetical protein